MDKQEIIAFMNANQACHLATVEGDAPHVRGMMIYRVDENGIIFHTGKPKDLHKQLQANPKVEFCFNNFESGLQIRVSGVARLSDDEKLKQEIVAARPFLKQIADSHPDGFDMIAVYRVKDLEATTWTMETNLAPKTFVKLD